MNCRKAGFPERSAKKYRSTTVTYTFGPATEVLDSATISSWIRIEGEKISIDEEAAKAWVQQLAADYDTIYVPRTFRTSYGNDITVSGNEYGFRIDQEAELKQLLEDLKQEQPFPESLFTVSGDFRETEKTILQAAT